MATNRNLTNTADRSARPAPHLALGAWGERVAARRYQRDGYRVLDRNWRCPSGELDLVVSRGGVIAFCEVKTRRSTAYGLPAEAVDGRRQRRLRAAAAQWLREHEHGYRSVRFDVVSVLPGRVERIEAAF